MIVIACITYVYRMCIFSTHTHCAGRALLYLPHLWIAPLVVVLGCMCPGPSNNNNISTPIYVQNYS